MPQDSIKKAIILDHFSWKNGPNDLDRGLFLSLYFGPYISPTCWSLCAILGPFGTAPMPESSIQNLFSDSFILSLLQDWAY
jgi:hypothetical protein